MNEKRRIAVFGVGNVGGTLGRLWAAKGHDVSFGGRGSNTVVTAPAEVVALCVSWSAARDAIRNAGDLTGKIIIDCTNPLTADSSGLAIGLTTSAGEQIATWAPSARVVKAFNRTLPMWPIARH
jgi:predicted dinucleotide-binding enzyme